MGVESERLEVRPSAHRQHSDPRCPASISKLLLQSRISFQGSSGQDHVRSSDYAGAHARSRCVPIPLLMDSLRGSFILLILKASLSESANLESTSNPTLASDDDNNDTINKRNASRHISLFKYCGAFPIFRRQRPWLPQDMRRRRRSTYKAVWS